MDLLTQAKRDSVPIRNTFVQQGKGKATKPGPLASFVSKHDERGLDAYLFVHALASAEPWNCDYPSSTWIRALGLADSAEQASAQAAASKIMKRLEDRHLITRERVGRTSSITLLSEDGTGDPYTHPAKARQQYLQLPHAYWTEHHYEELSLPAKAVLLIALSLRPRFPLPYERGPGWYGLSADSTERGLRDLEKAGLLDYSYEDFVEGLRPELGKATGGQLSYVVRSGLFLEVCEAASADKDNTYVLVIDELNRADLGSVLGELMILLEYREDASVQLPYSQRQFTIPDNLVILATMNTADRSLALVDFAMRRRFHAIELRPNRAVLQQHLTLTVSIRSRGLRSAGRSSMSSAHRSPDSIRSSVSSRAGSVGRAV